VSFANLEEVSLRSLTSGEPAELFRTTADGTWAGFVRMQPGANRIEVTARASDGSQTARTLEVSMAEEGVAPAVPPDLVLAHNSLLEECLRTVKSVRMEAERVRAEQVRRQLREEIERERARARERASEQRKQLQLEVDEAEEPSSP
jgi:predicted ribosome quality control (RQC) complex YloA/Tae2 family protein